jgi:pimeloyl-ACP methyl ester carboxylesterase
MAESQVSEFTSTQGGEPAFLVQPNEAPKALILFLHWFDEAPNANRTQFLDEARALADFGYASVLPQLMFPWKTPPTGAKSDIDHIRAEGSQLVELVAGARKEVGAEILGIVGHDFGAMHGALVASELQSACNVFLAPTPRWSDWFLRFWPIDGDRFDYMRSLAPIDPITAAAQFDAPTMYQFAKHDFFIAPMTGLELFNATAEPKTMLAYETDHSLDIDEARTDRRDFLVENLPN